MKTIEYKYICVLIFLSHTIANYMYSERIGAPAPSLHQLSISRYYPNGVYLISRIHICKWAIIRKVPIKPDYEEQRFGLSEWYINKGIN